MGVIGIVAALTIPNLNASTNDAEKVAKLKKEYAVLNEALNRATAVYGPIGTWFVNDGDDYDKKDKRFADRISEFLKLTKPVEKNDNDDYTFTLADGAVISLYIYDSSVTTKYLPEPNILFGGFGVNLDGKSYKPGINYFEFSITDKGVIPNGFASKEACKARGRSGCDSLISDYVELTDGDFESAIDNNNGYDVTWWVINMGNMDYLRCGDDLNWTTKTSCK